MISDRATEIARRFLDIFNQGEPLDNFLVQQLDDTLTFDRSGESFGVALACALNWLDHFRRKLVMDAGEDTVLLFDRLELERTINRALAAHDHLRAVQVCRLLEVALAKCRAADPSARVEMPAAFKRQQASAPAPLEVRIVGMPDRTTTTDVTRDESDNIVTTTQIEQDA